MSRWEMEIDMCCDDQVRSLYNVLVDREKSEDFKSGDIITSAIASTPFTESLFDSLRLYVRINEDNRVELIGRISDWQADRGYYGSDTHIHDFKDINECINWLGCSSSASDYCTEAFLKR